MCGIFAIISNRKINEIFQKEKIEMDFKKGKSRGPEDEYFKIDNNICLGFHRLAINGLSSDANQPLFFDNIILMCNGEIYNSQQLIKLYKLPNNTGSDCEVIIHLYKIFGFKKTLQLLDGVFAISLYDSNKNHMYFARDTYGVRPLYFISTTHTSKKEIVAVASNLKQLLGMYEKKDDNELILQKPDYFKPGTFVKYKISNENLIIDINETFIEYPKIQSYLNNFDNILEFTKDNLIKAVKKRITNTERPIACLLSGGLDSSLIVGIVVNLLKEMGDKRKLETYSIGLPGSVDLHYSKLVADHLKTNHTEVQVSEDELFNVIPDVIYNLESYDTTSVRATAGNYLIAKYISENSEAKVILNGDGSDELLGGYMYFHKCPNSRIFDNECRRLLKNIYKFDVLRSDKSMGAHGLEARTPYLDLNFTRSYLSVNEDVRFFPSNPKAIEKEILRKAFDTDNEKYLPRSILWRKKEAFSDGVSSQKKAWFQIINEKIEEKYIEDEDFKLFCENVEKITYFKPQTLEEKYYRFLFNKNFENHAEILPYFWMPRFVTTTDPSARTLEIYNKL